MKMKWGWLVVLAIAAAGVSTSVSAAATGDFICLQKSNGICQKWGTLPTQGVGTQGPAGPQGPAGDPTLPLKADNPAGHASYARDTRWCGIGTCDETVVSVFEIGVPVQAGTVSQLLVSLGEEPYQTWGEDVKYREGAIVTWNGIFYQALESNFGCQPGVGGSNLCFNSNDFKHWLNGGDPSAIWIVVTPPGPNIHGQCTPGNLNDGNAYIFQLCVGHTADGSVDCSNGVSCAISDGAFTCSSPAGASVAVNTGDVLALQIGPQSDPAWCAVNATVNTAPTTP
jgi:hypothetical protein